MNQQTVYQHRIGLVTSSILIGVVILVGVIVFSVMGRHVERLLSSSLQSSLENHASLIQAQINGGLDMIEALAGRPFMIEQLAHISEQEDDAQALASLKTMVIPAILKTGISGIVMYGPDGRELTRAGTFAQPTLSVPLNLPHQTHLMWQNGFVLQAKVDVKKAGKTVGTILAETPLNSLAALFNQAKKTSNTRELALCSPLRQARDVVLPLAAKATGIEISSAFAAGRAPAHGLCAGRQNRHDQCKRLSP